MAGACLCLGGLASLMLSNYPAAFERALEALALLDEQPPNGQQVALRARALNTCFSVCFESGDLDQALDYSRATMTLAEAGGDPYGAARALHNHGTLLSHLHEHDAARPCLRDAAARYEALPERAAYGWFARVGLAMNCLDHARQLAGTGQPRAARAQRRLAAWALPPLLPATRDPPHMAELSSLDMWIKVRAELGHLDAARQGLRRYLRLVRRGGRLARFQAHAIDALAAYHFRAGRTAHGLRLRQAAVVRLAGAGKQTYQLRALEVLVRVQAEADRHGEALQTLRAIQTLRARLAIEQAAMRSRLTALQRQVQQRVAQQREARAHERRLAVMGRLLADIHLALAGPTRSIHAALQSGESTPPPDRGRVLRQVVEQVDAAAGLVRQLKMFAYRGAPHPAAVGLHEAVRDAWAGIAQWRRGPAPAMAIGGDLRMEVRADRQLLSVLLRILLMEADRDAGQAESDGALQAHLERRQGSGRLALCGPGLTLPEAAQARRIGFTLCREMAQEMGGELTLGEPPSGGQGLLLQLPGA